MYKKIYTIKREGEFKVKYENEKLKEFEEYIVNRKVAIIGLGVSNLPLIDYFHEKKACVTVFDSREIGEIPKDLMDKITNYSIEFSFGKNYLSKLKGYDLILRSPSCLPTVNELEEEAKRGAIVTTEVELLMKMCPCQIIGITGSDGKTTTTTLISEIIKKAGYKCFVGGNIGTPLFTKLCEISPEDKVVLELSSFQLMGMEISPDVAVITNIGQSHIENLGSRDGILKAKLEITEGLPNGAPLILNGDNDKLATVKNDNFNICFYGIENGEFKAENIVEHDSTTDFDIVYRGDTQHITIPTIGVHNVYNALAAFTVGYFLDVPAQDAANALASYVPAGMRQKVVTVGKITSIEDCYNASPDSMRAAIRTLRDTAGNKKIAVLGDMLELGDYAETAHTQVGEMVGEYGIDYLLAYGKDAAFYVSAAKNSGCENAFLFDDKDALTKKLLEITNDGDAVIFKGSRGMKLEDVINSAYKVWEK